MKCRSDGAKNSSFFGLFDVIAKNTMLKGLKMSRTHQKLILAIVAILILSPVAGLILTSCIPTAGEVQIMTNSSVALQKSFVDLKNAVKESEVIDQDRADKIFGEVESVLADMADVTTAIEGREGVDAVKEGVKATSGWNTYAALILAGISIIEALGLFGINKKSRDKGIALEEVVLGVEKLKAGAKPKEAFAKETIATRNMVSLIKNKVA